MRDSWEMEGRSDDGVGSDVVMGGSCVCGCGGFIELVALLLLDVEREREEDEVDDDGECLPSLNPPSECSGGVGGRNMRELGSFD